MCWLNFITLNCVAPIKNLHQISDAGAGEGLMQLHPTRDTELIACGQANTLLNGESFPSPVLGNGSVTPAILVHGIFRALQQTGYKIRLHCYQLGLDNDPDFSHCKLDDVVIHHCELGDEATLMEQVLVPELRRQADNGEAHLIAESGIGGTTFATLWLRRWVNRELWFAGSTKDADKLNVKKQIIEELTQQTAELPLCADEFVNSLHFSDPIQRACCSLLNADLASLNFAGGAMIFAPLIAKQGSTNTKALSVATTRWVFDSNHTRMVADVLPENCTLHIPKVEFHRSRFKAIKMYENGYVIEGCGLGACLDFAERQGIEGEQLVKSLDDVVEPWLL